MIGATAARSITAAVAAPTPEPSVLAAQTAIARASAASSGRGRSAMREDHLDHPLDLLLVGRAVARDRRLDLVRGRLADRHAVLGRREQHDPARLADGEGRLHVLREEQPLDGDDPRLVERDELVDAGCGSRAAARAATGRAR